MFLPLSSGIRLSTVPRTNVKVPVLSELIETLLRGDKHGFSAPWTSEPVAAGAHILEDCWCLTKLIRVIVLLDHICFHSLLKLFDVLAQ